MKNVVIIVMMASSLAIACGSSGGADLFSSGAGAGGGTGVAGSVASGGGAGREGGGTSGANDVSGSAGMSSDGGKNSAGTASGGAAAGTSNGGAGMSNGGASAGNGAAGASSGGAGTGGGGISCPDVYGDYKITSSQGACNNLKKDATHTLKGTLATCGFHFASVGGVNGGGGLDVAGGFSGVKLYLGDVQRDGCSGSWNAVDEVMTATCGGPADLCTVVLERQ